MLRLLLLILLIAPLVQAQVPDTTEAARYFPLEVGNLWEYERHEYPWGPTIFKGWTRRVVTQDSVVNGTSYAVVRRTEFDASGQTESVVVKLLRFDPELARVVRATPDDDEFWYPCPLDAPFFDSVPCDDFTYAYEVHGGHEATYSIGDDIVVGPLKYFETGHWEGNIEMEFAADIGPRSWIEGDIPAYTGRLVFARIDGNEFGHSIPVSTEHGPAGAAGVILSMAPNPAVASSTAYFTLPLTAEVELQVLDLLGRRVASQPLGVLAAGDHQVAIQLTGLPTGVYVLRLVGDGGALATSRLTLAR